MTSKLKVGLIIVGDEILSGKRKDQHFFNSIKILSKRGLSISWMTTIGDDKDLCKNLLHYSFSRNNNPVFCFGGIGSTPDDNTRQACADALNLPLKLNTDAEKLITKKFRGMNIPISKARLEMGDFPEGAKLIPNPVNEIPGFYIKNHYFLPGFPNMASPMMEWVLDSKYQSAFFSFVEIEYFFLVNLLFESTITPVLKLINEKYPLIRVYSLPQSKMNTDSSQGYSLEIGLKMPGNQKKNNEFIELQFRNAIDVFRFEILNLGGLIIEEGEKKR